MDWVRLNVGYFRNPKIRHVGHDAAVLHLASVLYLGEHDLGHGRLPLSTDADLVYELRLRQGGRLIERLVEHRLWVPSEGGGYVVHDFDVMNGDLSDGAQARERKRRQRERQRAATEANGHIHA